MINSSLFSRLALSVLPEPSVIDTPNFTVIRDELVKQFVTLDPNYRLLLESDPVAKLIEVFAYRELVLRTRINEAAAANLLAKANGSDLDQLAAFYDVSRLTVKVGDSTVYPPVAPVMESDDSLRYRVQTRIMAWANAGGVAHYEYWASSADSRVKQVTAYSPNHGNGYNMGGRVVITVLSTEGNGVPTQEVLTNVENVVLGPEVKVVSDIVSVEPAVLRTVNVAARIKLHARVPRSVFDALQPRLLSEFAALQGLGADVTRSWLIDRLHEEGVHSVDLISPAVDFLVPANEFPSLGTVSLEFAGFADAQQEEVTALEVARLTRLMYETYIEYCISAKRDPAGITQDLGYGPRTGIIEPTVRGLATHLGITAIYSADQQTLLTELELATLIWNAISPRYAA